MTDHSEVRRDAPEEIADRIAADHLVIEEDRAWFVGVLRRVDRETRAALLAELEQSEQARSERDEAKKDALDMARGIRAANAAAEDMAARLASVPALVEALRYIGDESHAMPPTAEGMRKRARAALTVYEQSQGNG